MRRFRFSVRALGACITLWLSGCGSSEESPSEHPSTGSGQLCVATTGIQYLFGVDIASGKTGLSRELATNPVEVSALTAGNGLVWAGRSDGSLLAVDQADSFGASVPSVSTSLSPSPGRPFLPSNRGGGPWGRAALPRERAERAFGDPIGSLFNVNVEVAMAVVAARSC